MKNNASKKHHYLPRYYLKGFTNSTNRFFIYDKEKDNIFPSSPDDAFFENKLNTVTLPNGEPSDFLEEMYTEIENKSWRSLDKIRESTDKTLIEPMDRMHIFLFLLFLYWRIPSNIAYAESLSEKAFVDGGEFDYFRIVNKSGQIIPKEFIEVLKNSQAFKKTFRQVIPFIPFYKDKHWAEKLINWQFYYTEDDKIWYMVGDSPIIVREDNEHDLVNCLKEFVFPISGRILLSNVNKPTARMLPPEFAIDYNTAIIHKAQRFVACQSKDFLEAMVKYYKLYVQNQKTDTIIPDMFDSYLT